MTDRPRVRWLQYSLRVLLLAMSVFCLWLAVQARRARQQHLAVQAITQAGGTVYYDYQVAAKGFDGDAEPRAPAWLRQLVGDDFFRNVASVTLSNASETDECLEWLPAFTKLKSLTVSTSPVNWEDGFYQGWARPEMKLKGQPLTDRGLAHLKHLVRLERLSIGGAQISNSGLRHLAGLQSLENLGIGTTPITDQALVHLRGLRNLKGLDLRSSRIGDAGLTHLTGLRQLEGLALDRTCITDAGMQHVGKLTSLTSLSIAENDISDAGLAQVSNLSKLQMLAVNDTRITDAGLERLRNHPELERLYLHATCVGDSGLRHLRGLTKLQLLDLRGTQVTDAGLSEEVTKLSSLQNLWIDQKPYSPADLKMFSEVIRYGSLVQPRVTPEGIQSLQQVLPTCGIRP